MDLNDIDDQLKFGHLLFYERKCRTCEKTKNLIDQFYRTHKERGAVSSSFSYECKDCTIKRITKSRKSPKPSKVTLEWEYPDW